MDYYRIHGDNIVECERIVSLILKEIPGAIVSKELLAPSTINVDLEFDYNDTHFQWHFDLLPGFNKSGRSRWDADILKTLHQNGSFLAETPDTIITKVENNTETIICAIEFCSALQAGNQAWQRNGRAFSTGRAGCPYLYIVDFVKYELISSTRERKSLRFPNPAVPYSYISFSKSSENFVAQVYVRSEEFDINADPALEGFDINDFGEAELSRYLVKLMCGFNTTIERLSLLQKNLNVVLFLADKQKNKNSTLSRAQWQRISTYTNGIIEYSLNNTRFNFKKKISSNSDRGHVSDFINIVANNSIGLSSKDLPIGIIPPNKRTRFAESLSALYPHYNTDIIDKISSNDSPLLVCIIKGFKPGGDDNRPDRGILPLAGMLSGTDIEVLTFIYGPIIYNNYDNLINHPKRLAAHNGFWKSFIALSNYIAIDAPILRSDDIDETQILLETTELKAEYTLLPDSFDLSSDLFSSLVSEYHEDDVDTGIHYTFTSILGDISFEGLCNPPGGDWSGISIIDGDKEKRWLSLPRVSGSIAGKRPDHVYEIWGALEKPILLSIESKENSGDLESNVGNGLVNYLKYLMSFVPNVEKPTQGSISDWQRSNTRVDDNNFEIISAAAYLKSTAQDNRTVFANSNCDMLFVMEPDRKGWRIEISTNTPNADILKQYIKKLISASGNDEISVE